LATAYVLINVEIGSEEEVLRNLDPISEVKEAHLVYGVYDIIAVIETETMDPISEVKEAHLVYGVYDIIAVIETETMQELKDTVSWKIRRLDKVRTTLTMIVV